MEEAFELVEEVVRKLKWKVAASDPPEKPGAGGTLEATDLTPVIGFTDDIVVRVEGNSARARIDVRSASRFGMPTSARTPRAVRRFSANCSLAPTQPVFQF